MQKKLLLFSAAAVITITATAQIDSAQTVDAIGIGMNLANSVHPTPIIPGVDNNLLSSIVTATVAAIIGLLHRRKTIKKWKKNGTLDKNV